MKSAIVHPNSILGKALHERLVDSPILHLDSLLTTHEEEVGTLSEAEREAALIQLLTGDEADIYFVCGNPQEQRRVAETVQRGVIIHVEPTDDATAFSAAGAPLGINEDADSVRVFCPSPVGAALTQLLSPLADLDLFASVVVLRGASFHGGAAVDELLEQARALLSFSGEMPTDILPVQLAFNAVGMDSAAELEREADSLLPATRMSIRILEIGIFHGVGLVIDLQPRNGSDGGADLTAVVADRIGGGSYVTTRPAVEILATRDVSDNDGILLSEVQSRRHGVGLWAVFDNLTVAARNAVEIAEALPDRWHTVN